MTTQRTDNLELPLLDDSDGDSFYAAWVEAMGKINEGDRARQVDIAALAESMEDPAPAIAALQDGLGNEVTNRLIGDSSTLTSANAYTDSRLGLLTIKDPVRVAVGTNVNLSTPGSTADGVALNQNDRVLLYGQTLGAENGFYRFNGASSGLTRTADADVSVEIVPGLIVAVTEGSSADQIFELKTDGTITLGTTALTFEPASGSTTGLATQQALTTEVNRATAAEADLQASKYVVFNVVTPLSGAVMGANQSDLQKLANFNALANAYTAAYVVRADVYTPPGVFEIGTTLAPRHNCIALQPYHTGLVKIRGAGKESTVIKLGGTVSQLCNANGSNVSYRWTEFSDFTLDANYVTPNPFSSVVFDGAGDSDYINMFLRRVDTINLPPIQGNPFVGNFSILVNGSASGTLRKVYNIVCEDYDFGRGGTGGGNFGVKIGGYAYTAYTPAQLVMNGLTSTNAYIDKVHIKNFNWDAGSDPSGTYYASCGIQIGQNAGGGKVLIENGKVNKSRDDNIEINGMLDITIRNVDSGDSRFEGFYITNLGGIANVEKQMIRIEDCRFVQTLSTTSPSQMVFGGTMPLGHIRMRNNIFDGQTNVVTAVQVAGNFRSLVMDDTTVIRRNSTLAATFSSSNYGVPPAVQIYQYGGNGSIEINDLTTDIVCTYDGNSNTVSFRDYTVLISAVDTDLTIRNVKSSVKATVAGGASFTHKEIALAPIGTQVDNFSNSTTMNNNFIPDAGQLSDLSYSSSTWKPSGGADLNKEQRWLSISQKTSYVPTGPYTDGAFYAKAQPGAVINGFKGGAVYWLDTNNFIEAWVTDNGSSSFLNLDKVIGGVRTALTAPVALGARITASTFFWVRLMVQNNTVTASYHTSTPGITTVGATTSMVTLTGNDATQFGDKVQGYFGWSMIPKDAGAALGEIATLPMMVLRGEISHVAPKYLSPGMTEAIGIESLSTPAQGMRIGRLSVHDCDWSQLRGTTVTEYKGFTDPAHQLALTKYANTLASGLPDGSMATNVDVQNTQASVSGAYQLPGLPYTEHVLTITGNTVVTPPPPVAGLSQVIWATQGGAGGYTIDWSAFTAPGGTRPTFSSGVGKHDKFVISCDDGVNWGVAPAGQDWH